jgi:hypothetical protein
MSHQEGEKRWNNSNMFYSIATILRTDIAIATHLQTGTQVCQVLQIHRAGPYPTIPHPANLMPPIAECQWAPQPPPGERRLSKVSLITLLDIYPDKQARNRSPHSSYTAISDHTSELPPNHSPPTNNHRQPRRRRFIRSEENYQTNKRRIIMPPCPAGYKTL